MRWENFFTDLRTQLELGLEVEEADLRGEEERYRLGALTLRDRIRSLQRASFASAAPTDGRDRHGACPDCDAGPGCAEGRPLGDLRILLASGQSITVRIVALGRDWLSADLMDGARRHSQCIVPLAAIAGLQLSRAQVEASLGHSEGSEQAELLSARLGLPFILRDLCRRRSSLELRLREGVVLYGTIDRAGSDHLDLAVHERGSVRRDPEVACVQVVPLHQIMLIRV